MTNDLNWALARKQQTLWQRARIIQNIRAFFIHEDFLEVETPHRIPANAPEPYIDAVVSDGWFLHTSPELAMKRLLAAGYDKLFQVCRVWRQGERGARHLPEFTLLEWYRTGHDYRQLMHDCEKLISRLVPDKILSWQGKSFNLTPPWEQMSVQEAFSRYAGMSSKQALQTGLFNELLTSQVEPRLGQEKPTFLTDYPSELAALARVKPDNPEISERFELYIAGVELANAFSELADPLEQRRRFQRDEAERRAAGKTPVPLPEPFLTELASLPDAAGIALGIDRLIMLLTDQVDITDVVAFTPEQL